jgi:hypothetical protein
MSQHALPMHYQHLDSPELARRRENLASFEREAREARRRRRRAFVSRNLNGLRVLYRDGETRVQPCDSSAVGEALR